MSPVTSNPPSPSHSRLPIAIAIDSWLVVPWMQLYGIRVLQPQKCTFNSNDRVSMYLHPFQFSEKRKKNQRNHWCNNPLCQLKKNSITMMHVLWMKKRSVLMKKEKKYRGKRKNKWKEKSNDYFSIRVDKRCNVLDSPYLLTHSVSEVCRFEDASGSRTLR